MKITIVSILLMFLTVNDCSERAVQEITTVTYNTFTRGSSTEVIISSEEIQIESKGLEPGKTTATIAKKDWEAIMAEIHKIDLSKLDQFEAPSQSRASDASAHATLSIVSKGTQYETSNFDHGNPPEALKPLVEAILRLAENVE